jgi:hypothetical protein
VCGERQLSNRIDPIRNLLHQFSQQNELEKGLREQGVGAWRCETGPGQPQRAQSHMNPDVRRALVHTINRDLEIIQNWLNQCFIAMQFIENRFKEERKSIFEEIRRQKKRSAKTLLILKVHLREYNVLNVPVAEWRKITAKGNSVDNAQATMFARREWRPRTTPVARRKGQMAIFSDTIPKNRKHGWRIPDLTRYTHALECQLVEEIEVELRPIRKRIARLTKTGSSLAQSRHQHQRMLDRPEGQPAAGSSRKKKSPPSLAEKERLAQLEFETQSSRRKPDPPQFRKPIW